MEVGRLGNRAGRIVIGFVLQRSGYTQMGVFIGEGDMGVHMTGN